MPWVGAPDEVPLTGGVKTRLGHSTRNQILTQAFSACDVEASGQARDFARGAAPSMAPSDRGQVLYFMLKHAFLVIEEVAQRVVN
jgi:hypothetical protein